MSMLSRFPTTATAGIQYVGGTTAQITGSTATTTNVSLTGLTGGLAAAAAAGDVVVVFYGVGSTVARTLSITTSGYTQLASLTVSDTFDANLVVSYKRMGGTPDTQVTVSATGATADSGAVALQVWRYVDQYAPIDVAVTTATSNNTVLADPPAITPATAGAMIIAGGAGAHARGVATYSSSDLRNFITVGGIDNTNDVTVGMGSRAGVSGAAFNPAAFTFSAADSGQYSYCAVTLALCPVLNGKGPATFIASASTQNGAAGSSLVINKPTGTTTDDLMIAIMASDGGKGLTWTGDTGWTEVADQGAGVGTPGLRVAYKVAGASEGASYTFTGSTNNNILAGSILTYRGASYDAIGSFVTGTAAGSLTPTGPTAASAYATLIGVSASITSGNTYTIPTAPMPMTAQVTDSDGTAPSYVIADEIVRAGATGTRTFTSTGVTTGTAAIMLTIKAT